MTKAQLKQLIREAYSELTVDNPDYASDWAAVLINEVKKIFGDKYQGYNFLDKSNRVVKIYTSVTQPIIVTQTPDKSILPDKVFSVKEGNGKVTQQRGWSSLFKYLESIKNQSTVVEGDDRGHPDEPLLKWLNKRLAGGRESDYDIRGALVKLRDKLSKDVEAHKSRKNVKENVDVLTQFDMRKVASGLEFKPYFLKPGVGNVATNPKGAVYIALYKGKELNFESPWGEEHYMKPGDYLVRDPESDPNRGRYYRITKDDFEKNYKH